MYGEKVVNEKISVIIPVYNVEKYLKHSIESILKQKYSNLQIILIDDGSTDKSGEICDSYAQKDDRITVVHQKNGGAANAKNKGLCLATGKYLTFLDSDDYLEPEAYDFMVNQLEKYDADIVQCCFRNVFIDKTEDKCIFTETVEMDTSSYLKLFTQDWTCGLLWDKLYRREIFEGIFFDEGHKIDDEFFTYKGVMNAKKIVRIPKIVYNYRQRLSSVMMSENSQEKIIVDKLEYLSIRRKIVADKFPKLKRAFDEHYLNMLLILSKDFNVSVDSMKYIKKLLKEYYRESQRIKLPFSVSRRLFYLRYSSIDKLMKKKVMYERKREVSSYYK